MKRFSKSSGFHIPFDIGLVADQFPPHLDNYQKATDVETDLALALWRANSQLTPTETERLNLSSLVIVVQSILEEFVADASLLNPTEIKSVVLAGDMRKDTLTRNAMIAEMIVVLANVVPTLSVVNTMMDVFKSVAAKKSPYSVFHTQPHGTGFMVKNTTAAVQISLSASSHALKGANFGSSADGPYSRHKLAAVQNQFQFLGIFLDIRDLVDHHDDNLSMRGHIPLHRTNDVISALIRILKDIQRRMAPRFDSLTEIMIETLVVHCVTTSPFGQTVNVDAAFRRIFQLLSAGLFLPYSTGLINMTDSTSSLRPDLSFAEADSLCANSQFVLRTILTDCYEFVLDPNAGPAIFDSGITSNNLVINPPSVVREQQAETVSAAAQ